jgi:hypothetical protein
MPSITPRFLCLIWLDAGTEMKDQGTRLDHLRCPACGVDMVLCP